MKGNTQTVSGLMEQCYKAYNTVKYFVEKAFGDNPAVQDEFRMGDLHKVKKNQLGMIDLMGDISAALKKHTDTLLANGMTQVKIDEIVPLAGQLNKANTNQEASKHKRPLGTQERVETLNKLYLLLKQLSDTASLVFDNNEAKMKAYKLPA
jgi:hypothetical protein